ncbi:hypothetical protein F5146DRAFT_1147317 [Armillaria mellea]|nr:hypothetical protein F5146DRAFT_1147317 [Armillaria mellea]
MLKSRGVPSAVIDYLVSNQGMVELTFEVETDRGNVSKQVLSELSGISLSIVVEGNKNFTNPMLSLLKALPSLQMLRLVAHTNNFTLVIKCVERICDNEPLLKRLQIVVSVSYLGHIKFGAGQSGWDFNDKEVDVLQDDPWYLGA